MNDSALNALLKLTYFIVKQNNVDVESIFLNSIKEYLQKFNFFVEEEIFAAIFNLHKNKDIPSYKNLQNHQKEEDVKSICISFDNDLLLHEKVFIAICLIECTSKLNLYTQKTKEILRQLIVNCGINSREFNVVQEFVLENEEQKLTQLSDLFISGNKEIISEDLEGAWIEKNRPSEMDNIPNIIHEAINGKIFFHYQLSLNNIFFKYNGDEFIYLNKEVVKPGELYLFKNKDKLLFENKVIVDYKELSNSILKQFSRNAIVYTGKSIEYNSKRQFNSLKSFTFSEKSGTLVGLVGNKNSEKHILIKILAGELIQDKGSLLINCYDTRDNKFKTQGLIGYVPNESRLREGLTIYENYYYATKLYLRNYSNKKIKELIHNTFIELGLQNITSIVWNNQTKENLSVLQLKLIGLGFELIKDPSILILEEFSEGLLLIETQSFIGVLRQQAMKGKLIIASATPPLMFNIKEFDSIWCFDKGGYPIYNGKPDNLLSYFSDLSSQVESEKDIDQKVDVWQIINKNKVDTNGEYTNKRKVSPKDWKKFYDDKIAPKIKIHGYRNVLPQSRVKLPDLDKQLFVFLIRDLKAFFRQPPLFFKYLSVMSAIAMLTGLFCRHSISETYSFSSNYNISFFYFLNTINSLVFGIWIGVGAINREGSFYRLNKLNNISSISYFSGKISLHILLMFVLFSAYVLISYSILEHLSAAVRHFLIYLLIGVAGSTAGYNIAIYTKSTRNVYLLSIAIVVFQVLFSGQIVPFERFPFSQEHNKKYVPVISEFSILKWGHEALIVDQAINNNYSKRIFEEERFLALSKIYNEVVLHDLQFKVNNCLYALNDSVKSSELNNALISLKSEIENIPNHFEVFPFEYVSLLDTENFNEEIGMECINYINYIIYFLFEESEIQKTNLKLKLDSINSIEGINYKEKYYNESVQQIVTRQNNTDNLSATHHLYVSPDSKIGRSHLYAYQKLFNGHFVNTFWFNLIVIWIAVGIAYIFLITEFIHYARNQLNKYFHTKY